MRRFLKRLACGGLMWGGVVATAPAQAQVVVSTQIIVSNSFSPPPSMLTNLVDLERAAMEHFEAWDVASTPPVEPTIVDVTITRTKEILAGLPVYNLASIDEVITSQYNLDRALSQSKLNGSCRRAGWSDLHYVSIAERKTAERLRCHGKLVARNQYGVSSELAWLRLERIAGKD